MKRRKRKQKTPEQERRRSNRRQRFFHALGRVIFIGVLLIAALLALTVFFRVHTISVEGAMRYSAEEIVSNLDVREGDNLYLWNKVKTSNALMERLPYLESVQIRRHLPDTLVVTVTECTAVAAVQNEGGYLYLSRYGKVLEQNASDGGLATVTGVDLSGYQPGQLLETGQDAYIDALLEVMQTLDAGGMLDGLSFINLQDLTDVRIGYQDRFDIRVGTLDDLAYRLRFANTVISERLSPSDIGRLYWDNQNRLHYVPDTAENVAASATGTQTDSSLPVNLDDVGKDDSVDGGDNASTDGTSGTDSGETDEDTGTEEEYADETYSSYDDTSYDEYADETDEWTDETGDETVE